VEHCPDLRTLLSQGASQFNLSLSEHQIEQFLSYVREILAWNQKINLTAIIDPAQIVIKHFLDSLAYSAAFQQLAVKSSLLDIGAGGGFPSLPLHILYPNLESTLLEPSRKKTAFLRYMIGTLGLEKARVISQTLQEFSEHAEAHEKFAYVTARAVNINSAICYVTPLLADHGKFIISLTNSLGSNLDTYGLSVAQEFHYDLPLNSGKRVLTILQNVPRGTPAVSV
jgi:16S rRNA (guanine527-N7)-methyltransferase